MTEREPVLQERLRALRGPDPVGDWLDVRRRARRPRRRMLALVAAVAVLIAVPTVAVGGRLLDVLGITASDERVPAPAAMPLPPYIHGDLLYGVAPEPRRLARRLAAPFLGTSAVVAVRTPDRRHVVYHAFEWEPGRGPRARRDNAGTPVLRVYDVAAQRDRELARGAQSVAVRADGAIAYLQANRPLYENVGDPRRNLGGRYGRVLVRASSEAPPTAWTADGTWIAHAWAGRALIVELESGGGMLLPNVEPEPGLYAADAPMRLRPLPLRRLVAVSPDGTRVIGTWGPLDARPEATRLVDVATGRILAELPIWLDGPAAWTGGRVIAVAASGGPRLLIIGVRPRRLVVERRLRLGGDPVLETKFGAFLSRPVVVDGGRSVVLQVRSVEADETYRFNGFLTCELASASCVRGRNLPPRVWTSLVADSD